MRRQLTVRCLVAALFLSCASLAGADTITYFQSTDISGTGLWASAVATVTTGQGYVDVLVQNTSPRQDDFEATGLSANPFITELEINLGGYQTSTAGSYVQSLASTWFAQGAGSAAT